MEKYGAIKCPACGSFKTAGAGNTLITVQHPDLIKEASAVAGGRFKCLDCGHVFARVTSQGTSQTVDSDS